ncbi:MAG: thiamine diphosphokinase [Bacteroidales bacterium]|nr:thiamine diphosphokinase [Bacteroidales bacterium]
MTTVILAHGEFPSSARTLGFLKQADRIICCDGAAERLLAEGIVPNLIIGDMDSLPSVLQQRYAGIVRKISEQETNDLTKAFKAALEPMPDAIHILGATGRREDHTMANVSLLADYAEMLSGSGCEIDMITESGTFRAFCAQDASFSCPLGVEISIFAFDNSLRMSCEGLLYNTDRVTFDTLWKATLNSSTAESFSLHLNHPAKVVVFICNPEDN